MEDVFWKGVEQRVVEGREKKKEEVEERGRWIGLVGERRGREG